MSARASALGESSPGSDLWPRGRFLLAAYGAGGSATSKEGQVTTTIGSTDAGLTEVELLRTGPGRHARSYLLAMGPGRGLARSGQDHRRRALERKSHGH